MTFETTIAPLSNNRRLMPGRGRLVADPEYRRRKEAMALHFRSQYHGEPLTVPVHVTVMTGLGKGDLDGQVKMILDALNGIAYLDDRQIVSLYQARIKERKISVEVIDVRELRPGVGGWPAAKQEPEL